MATTTPSTIQRKKRPATYGRKTATPTFSGDLNFFDEEDSSYSRMKESTNRPQNANSSLKRDVVALKVASATPSAGPRPQLHAKDAFDVSSSEDESVAKSRNRPAVTKANAKRPLMCDQHDSPRRTPAWSDKRPRLDGSSHKSVKFAEVNDKPVQISLPVHAKQTAATATNGSSRIVTRADLSGMTAIERLKYRQGFTGSVPSIDSSVVAASPRAKHNHTHQSLDDTRKPPRTTAATKATRVTKRSSTSPSGRREAAANTATRHGVFSRADQEANDAVMTEGLDELRTAVPLQQSKDSRGATSPRSSKSHARSGLHRSGALTPKQDRLWQNLFEDIGEAQADGIAQSPLAGTRQHSGATSNTTQSRLVDRLRAAASHDAGVHLSDQSDSDIEMSDVAVEAPVKDTTMDSPRRTAAGQASARLTYTQQRSHLAEDNIEDAMLLSLGPTSVSQSPRNRRGQASNISDAWALDDNDTQVAGIRIRTVHELRAQGKSSRVTAEIDELLQDVRPSATHTQRLNASIKLAGKLLDDEFVTTFTQRGHDLSLLGAFRETSDDLLLTIFTVASLLLLNHDLSKQALQTYKDVLLGMTRLFKAGTELTTLVLSQQAALGRSHMALATLLRKIRKLNTLWPGAQPEALSTRLLYLRTIDLLVGKLRRTGDASALLSDNDLVMMCPSGLFSKDINDTIETTLVISILESLSTLLSPSIWPPPLIDTIATLPATINKTDRFSEKTKFLAYRLCLNITNDRTIDHFLFARAGSLQCLLQTSVAGFGGMATIPDSAEERKLKFDLLILAVGILINLSEYSKAARQAILNEPSASMLVELIHILQAGHEQTQEAESEDQSTENVAFGYLAIMLANFCQEAQVRDIVGQHLRGRKLDLLVQAVEEFVQHHQKVDRTSLDGVEGQKISSSFTERLKNVLVRLKKHI